MRWARWDTSRTLPPAAVLQRAFLSSTIGGAVEQRWLELLSATGDEIAVLGFRRTSG